MLADPLRCQKTALRGCGPGEWTFDESGFFQTGSRKLIVVGDASPCVQTVRQDTGVQLENGDARADCGRRPVDIIATRVAKGCRPGRALTEIVPRPPL